MRDRILFLLGFVCLLGCKGDAVPTPLPDVAADMAADIAAESDASAPEVESGDRLKWEGDFEPWYDEEVGAEGRLPKCPTGWFNNPVDDEFVVWKCSNYKGMELGDVGQFTVHTRNSRVFMVTNSFEFNAESELQEAITTLRKINAGRRIPLKERYQKIGSELWDLQSYVTLLSTGRNGLSLVYLKNVNDIEVLYQVVKRQSALSRVKKRYKLASFDIKVMGYQKEEFVGRGPERWDSKKATTFVVVEYEVRNLGRERLSRDPLTFTIIGNDQKFAIDDRAEQAYLTSDRTGRFKGLLEYRKSRPRAHVFEIAQDVVSRPMILIVSEGDQKLIYRLDLRQSP